MKTNWGHKMRGAKWFILSLGVWGFTSVVVAKPIPGKIWKMQCASCHGNDGRGKTPVGRALGVVDLTTSEFQTSRTDQNIGDQIRDGSVDENGITKMVPYGPILSAEEIGAMVAFVRTLEKGDKKK